MGEKGKIVGVGEKKIREVVWGGKRAAVFCLFPPLWSLVPGYHKTSVQKSVAILSTISS